MDWLMAPAPRSPGIYAIRHVESGRVYVGQTVNLRLRRNHHRAQANAGKHCNPKLQRAWAKHGEAAFAFEVLELVAEVVDLSAREQFWIDRLDAVARGFNICPAAGSALGVKRSDETKRRLSEAAKAVGLTPAKRAHLDRLHAGFVGKAQSAEHIEKCRLAKLGQKRSAESKARMSEARIGWKPKPESVAKQRASLTGRKQPADEIERRRLSMVGHSVGEETRQRISAAHKGRVCPPERREKIAAALAGHKQSVEQIAKRKATMDARSPEQIAQWKARISEAGKGRKMKPEAIAKRQAARYEES